MEGTVGQMGLVPLYTVSGAMWITRLIEEHGTMSYVEITLNPTSMVIRPQEKHRWLALRGSLYAAKGDVVSVEPGGRTAENGPTGLRFPGTNVPGRYIAGTFWRFWGDPAKREKSFWVRRHPDKCIRITFANHDYDFAMVEVDDPDAEIARIEAWLRDRSAP